MKQIKYILLFILIAATTIFTVLKFDDPRSNNTELGVFWYTGDCDNDIVKLPTGQNRIDYDDKILIHIVNGRSSDGGVYQFGKAERMNDTIKLKVVEKEEFFTYGETKRTMCLANMNLYFLCDRKAKYYTVQFDDNRPIDLDSLFFY